VAREDAAAVVHGIQALPSIVDGGLIADVVAVIGPTTSSWETATGELSSAHGICAGQVPQVGTEAGEAGRAIRVHRREPGEVRRERRAIPRISGSPRFSTRSISCSSSRVHHRRRDAHRRGADRLHRADVEDVVSYYTMFYTKPVGKYVLNVCRTLSCALLGAERVTEELAKTLGIQPGQTDPTGTFTLMEVECLGACDRAPVVMVNDDWHERLSPEQVTSFIDQIKTRGAAAFTGCHLHVEK
jgi:(2Fe-2S) ferredoxin